MSGQNGISNGVGGQTLDDTDGVTAARVMVVDETDDPNKDRLSSHSSRDSLNSDGNGQDNPAFEGDDSSTFKSEKVSKNGTGSTNSQPAVGGDNKEENHHGDVEMVPLNPAAAQQNHRNASGAKNTNGSSTNHKDQNKSALDSMYNDYFQPVNTRRKLLRGEKLYVTRDQRAHSRGWKWIAFWGGVFTFVAAALLTGILAATGIIMSKSEPSYSSSHRILGNGSLSNNTIYDFDKDDTNMTYSSTTELPMETSNVDINAESDVSAHSVTTESPMTFTDIGNSLEDGILVTSAGLPSPSPSPASGIMGWNATTTDATLTSLTTPTLPSVLTNDVNETSNSSPTSDRGRSLDEAVLATVLPLEDDTLFPAINRTLLEEHNFTTTVEPDMLFNASSTTGDELGDDTIDDPLVNDMSEGELENTTTVTEGVPAATAPRELPPFNASDNETPTTLPPTLGDSSDSTTSTTTEMVESNAGVSNSSDESVPPPNRTAEMATVASTTEAADSATPEVHQGVESITESAPLFPQLLNDTTENVTVSPVAEVSSPTPSDAVGDEPPSTIATDLNTINSSTLTSTTPMVRESKAVTSSLESVTESEITLNSTEAGSSGAPSVAASNGAPSVATSNGAPSVTTSSGAPSAATSSGAPSAAASSGTPSVTTSSGAPSAAASSGAPSGEQSSIADVDLVSTAMPAANSSEAPSLASATVAVSNATERVELLATTGVATSSTGGA